MNMSGVDPFLAVEGKGIVAEGIFADFSDEADIRSESSTADSLVGTLPAEVNAIAGSKKRFTLSRQAIGLHRQTGGVTSDNRNSRNFQCQSLLGGIRSGSLPQAKIAALL